MGWFSKTPAERVDTLIEKVKKGTAALCALRFPAARKAELKEKGKETEDDIQEIKAQLAAGQKIGAYHRGILKGFLGFQNSEQARQDLQLLPPNEQAAYQAVLRGIETKAKKVLEALK